MQERTFWSKAGAVAVMLLLATLMPRAASADAVALAWDANPESDVVGYYVFIGTASGVYTTVVDVGSATSYTFPSALQGTTYYLTVAAYVAGPIVGPYAPEIVTTTGRGPALSNPGSRTSTRGDVISINLAASDPDGDPVMFGAIGLPTGLTLDPNTGAITGSPTTAGTFNVSLSASDPAEHVTTQYFVWTIVPTDEVAPTIAVGGPTTSPSYSTSSAFITLTGTASDDVAVTAVTWANSRGGSGTAAGTSSWSVVIPLQSGANVLTMSARDATSKSSSTTLTVTVDLAPSITIGSPSTTGSFVSNAQTLSLSGAAADDGSVSSVSWSNNRGGSGTASGTTAWTASVLLQVGSNVITVTAHDNAAKQTTAQLTVNFVPAPLRVTSLTASRPSPQPAGTTITITASAGSGVGPYQFKWWIYNGSSWSVAQDWSTKSTLDWTPAARNDYRIGVWVRSAGRTADAADGDLANGSLWFSVTQPAAVEAPAPTPAPAPSPLRVTSLVADRATPQTLGTTITFNAAATGGTAPYQYKWWVHDGSAWVSQSWTSNSTFAWTPTSANSSYQVRVWARSAAATADSADNDDSIRSFAFAINAPVQVIQPSVTAPQLPAAPSWITLLTLTADLTAPQPVGTAVTFTASASGGSGVYQYKWWLYNGTTWSLLRDWSSPASYTWTPTSSAGAYRIGVWVRNAGSTLDVADNARANGSLSFPVASTSTSGSYTPASPLRLVALTPSVTSPQPSGTSVTVTAVATGGNPQYQYKWWLFDGRTWVMMRDWSQNATFTWTPGSAGTGYRIGVWVRSSTNALDQSDNSNANGSIAFVIQ